MTRATVPQPPDYLHEGLSREELDSLEGLGLAQEWPAKDRRAMFVLASCFVGMLLIGVAVTSSAKGVRSPEPMPINDANSALERLAILPTTR